MEQYPLPYIKLCFCNINELIYIGARTAEYGYKEKSAKGPKHWGDLKKEWAACKGEMQSPIDLSSDRVSVIPNLGKLNRSYKPQHATISNRGHDIAVSVSFILLHQKLIFK